MASLRKGIDPTEFMESLLDHNNKEILEMERKIKEATARKEELKRKYDEQAEQIRALLARKSSVDKSKAAPKEGQFVAASSTFRKVTSSISSSTMVFSSMPPPRLSTIANDSSVTYDVTMADFTDVSMLSQPRNSTKMIVQENLEAVRHGNTKRVSFGASTNLGPDSRDDTTFVEEEATNKSEIFLAIMEFHASLKWQNKRINVVRAPEHDSAIGNKKAFEIFCPECPNQKFIIYRSLNKFGHNDIRSYMQHVLDEHSLQ